MSEARNSLSRVLTAGGAADVCSEGRKSAAAAGTVHTPGRCHVAWRVRKTMKRSARLAIAGIALIMLFFLAVSRVQVGTWPWEWDWSKLPPYDYMNTAAVCRTWGEYPLNIEKFKTADRNSEDAGAAARAEMACSLLKNKHEYLGKDVMQIRNMFGTPTGYYWSEARPAYVIGGVDREDRNTWQIVFLPDGRTGRMGDIVVHKECC